MKKILSYLFLLNTAFVSAQDIYFDIDSLQVADLERNMMMYRFYTSNFPIFCAGEFNLRIQGFILEKDEHYNIKVFEIDNDQYPNKDLKLYSVINKFHEIVKKGEGSKVARTHFPSYQMLLSKRILVGLYKNKKELIYLSGDVFKDCIADDFKLDFQKPSTFYPFLEFKLFNYNIENIQFVKKKKKYILFKAKSRAIDSNILIKVITEKKDYDVLQVKVIETGWTENGAYHWKE